MGASVEDVLSLARSQIGVTSGRKYWREVYGYETNLAWCAVFDSWLFMKTGTVCPYFPSAVAFDLRDESAAKGRMVSKYNLQAGDAVSFDWAYDGKDGKGDHVGIVEKILSEGVIQTIEGNTDGGKVARRTRNLSDVICGIRPYYTKEKLETDGWFGKKSVTAWQEQLGAEHTNKWVGGQKRDSIAYHSHLTAVTYDGGGSRLIATAQKKMGKSASGEWNKAFSEALQAYLNKHGASLKVDGYAGAQTIKALQKSINDGVWA